MFNPFCVPHELSRIITKAEVLEAFGAAYTHKENEHKLIDFELGIALANELFPEEKNAE